MDFAWFLYTIAIMVIAIMAATSSVTVWVLTNRKDCLVAAAGFLAYAFDVAAILFDEYQGTKPLMSEYFNTGLTHPIANIVLRVAIIACVWLWVAMRVHAPVRKKHVIAFACVYALAAVLAAPLGPRSDVAHTMAFWGISDVLVLAALAFAWWWRNNRASETDRISIDRSKSLWRVALVLATFILLEDVFFIMILHLDSLDGWARDFFWHFTERNMSENILMIVLAVRMMLYNRNVIEIFSKHPMEDAGKAESVGSHRDFDSRLLRFVDDHGMSKREREVLALAVEGRDTQGIASELYISTGTVKAHMHRIYTKAGVESRQDLVTAFWKY